MMISCAYFAAQHPERIVFTLPMKINIQKSIELQKKYNTKKHLCYNNCISIIFTIDDKKVMYVEGVYKAQYGWIDHAWLIINNEIVDVTYTDWGKAIPEYYPCIAYSRKEVSEFLMRANGELPLYYLSPELIKEYNDKKEEIFKK